MKPQQAKELIANGTHYIYNDVDNVELLRDVLDKKGIVGAKKYYSINNAFNYDLILKNRQLIEIKLSEIETDIPNDVLIVVEKYGKDKLLTYFKKL